MEEIKVEQEEITKEEFEAYEGVRQSGVTNMFMVTTVCELSGLERLKVMQIMKQYSDLMAKYPDVRNRPQTLHDDEEEEENEGD